MTSDRSIHALFRAFFLLICLFCLNTISHAQEEPFALKRWLSVSSEFEDYLARDHTDAKTLENWHLALNAALVPLNDLLDEKLALKRQLDDQYAPYLDDEGKRIEQLPSDVTQAGDALAQRISDNNGLIIRIKSELARGRTLRAQINSLETQQITKPLMRSDANLFDAAAWSHLAQDMSQSIAQGWARMTQLGLFKVLAWLGIALALFFACTRISRELVKYTTRALSQSATDQASVTSWLGLSTRWLIRLYIAPFTLLFIAEMIGDALIKLWFGVTWHGHVVVDNIGILLALASARTILEPNYPAWRMTAFSDRSARQLYQRFAALQLLSFGYWVFNHSEATASWRADSFELVKILFALCACSLYVLMALVVADEREESSNIKRWQSLSFVIGLIMMATGVAAAVGYATLAIFIIKGVTYTIIAYGLVWVQLTIMLQFGQRYFASDDDALIPWWWIIISYGLFGGLFLALTSFAWGGSIAQLQENTSALVQGVTIGNTHFSLKSLLLGLVVLSVGSFIISQLKVYLRDSFLPHTKLDTGARSSMVTGAGYVGMTVIILMAVSAAGFDLSNVALIAGALSVGIGFGLQNIFNNFISGLILLVERPIKPGDWIRVGSSNGTVREIKVRSTEIETFDRTTIIVPNADLISQPIENWTHINHLGRLIVPVGVAYGSDVETVRTLMYQVANTSENVLDDPAPQAYFVAFGETALRFELRVFLDNIGDISTVTDELCTALDQAFQLADIQFPAPHRLLNQGTGDEH